MGICHSAGRRVPSLLICIQKCTTNPAYLDEVPNNLQNYGEISSYPPAIYYQSVGWYDNDAANLKLVSPDDEAERIVPLLGGRNRPSNSAMNKSKTSSSVLTWHLLPQREKVLPMSPEGCVTYVSGRSQPTAWAAPADTGAHTRNDSNFICKIIHFCTPFRKILLDSAGTHFKGIFRISAH